MSEISVKSSFNSEMNFEKKIRKKCFQKIFVEINYPKKMHIFPFLNGKIYHVFICSRSISLIRKIRMKRLEFFNLKVAIWTEWYLQDNFYISISSKIDNRLITSFYLFRNQYGPIHLKISNDLHHIQIILVLYIENLMIMIFQRTQFEVLFRNNTTE